jgi:hypothetical protein
MPYSDAKSSDIGSDVTILWLNVAVNRESKSPGIAEFTRSFLVGALRGHLS